TFGSAEDYRRLRRQVNAFILVELAAIIILSIVRYSVASPAVAYYWTSAFFGVLLFFLVLYLLWMRSWQGRLQPSDERLSLRDLVAPGRPYPFFCRSGRARAKARAGSIWAARRS